MAKTRVRRSRKNCRTQRKRGGMKFPSCFGASCTTAAVNTGAHAALNFTAVSPIAVGKNVQNINSIMRNFPTLNDVSQPVITLAREIKEHLQQFQSMRNSKSGNVKQIGVDEFTYLHNTINDKLAAFSSSITTYLKELLRVLSISKKSMNEQNRIFNEIQDNLYRLDYTFSTQFKLFKKEKTRRNEMVKGLNHRVQMINLEGRLSAVRLPGQLGE